MEIKASVCWMDPIKAYLQTRVLREDQVKAKRLERMSAKFIIHDPQLRGKSIVITGIHPFLQCLHLEDAELSLREIHEGMLGNHAVACTSVHNAIM